MSLLLVCLPHTGADDDVALDELFQPLLPILARLGLRELLRVDLNLQFFEGRLVLDGLHVALVLLEDVVHRGDILVENLTDMEEESDDFEEVRELDLDGQGLHQEDDALYVDDVVPLVVVSLAD